ncbi:MAG: XTP/dITP diphosphatase [Kiritimatiellae bacterium]|nr:XTP/dITP diphosphatase [Kiritimatiellia bacterium]
MNLILATRNEHKLLEIRKLFDFSGVRVQSALDFPEVPEVEEDGETFEANAIKKASTLCRVTGFHALADDSGLEVKALAGEPGVYSARYAGEPVDYHANNVKLLRELQGVVNREARFVCVMALAFPDGRVETVRGECRGRIAAACRGTNGFGYDPLFIPEGHEQTFGELEESVKSRISHRAHAMQQAVTAWKQLLAIPR